MRDSIYQLIPALEREEQLKAYDRIYNLMDFDMPPEEELNFLQEYLAAAKRYGDKSSSNQVTMHAAILNVPYKTTNITITCVANETGAMIHNSEGTFS